MSEPACIWAEGGSRVLDYTAAGGGAGVPVLFVPSLVNRAYILDLMPGHSMMRWLAGRGVRPLLLDWGWPEEVERGFGLSEYVAGRLERALEAVGGPVVLAGYCMGGLLAVAAAGRRPELVRGLALLATPWDFHAGVAAPERVAGVVPGLEAVMAASRTLPVDAIQALFSMVEPGGVAAKYRAFGAMDQGGAAAERFVAVEDWLNDGVPLAAPVARETLGGWYGTNSPARGTWRVEGAVVAPALLRMPCFVAVPDRDRIVPPEGALALAEVIPGAVVHRPRAGHIGMAAGPRAESVLWEPLLGWLAGI